MNEDNNGSNEPNNAPNDQSPSGQVISPGTEQGQQPPASMTEQATMPSPQADKPKKSKKPLIIGLVVLALLLVGAAVYSLVFANNSDDQADEEVTTQPEASVFAPEVFVQNDRQVSYLDESATLQDFATLEDNEVVVETVSVADSPEVRYVTVTETAIQTYGSITGDEKTTLITFEAPIDRYFNNLLTSPDGTKVLVQEVSEGSGAIEELVMYSVSDGSSSTVYTASTDEVQAGAVELNDKFLAVVGWSDNNNVLLQQQTCRQCDGPWLPYIYTLNTETGEISEFYKGSAQELGYAEVTQVAPGQDLYMNGGPYGKIFDPISSDAEGPDFLYKISNQGEATKLVETADILDFLGQSTDGNQAYYSTYSVPEGAESRTEYTKPVIYRVSAGGNPVAIEIETQFIKEGTELKSIADYSNGLIILAQNTNAEGSAFTYNLLKLPLNDSEDEFANLLEGSSTEFDSVKMFLAR